MMFLFSSSVICKFTIAGKEVSAKKAEEKSQDGGGGRGGRGGAYCSFHQPYVYMNNIFKCTVVNIFLTVNFNMFWVLKRTVSLRRFF